jgi:hypothetical protein
MTLGHLVAPNFQEKIIIEYAKAITGLCMKSSKIA